MKTNINLCFCLLLSSCSFPPYKIDIQQGNDVDEYELSQVKLGLTKRQVSHLIGNPPITDPFHQNRWDYLYTMDGERLHSHRIVLLFNEEDRLVRIDGDAKSDTSIIKSRKSVTVDVPEED